MARRVVVPSSSRGGYHFAHCPLLPTAWDGSSEKPSRRPSLSSLLRSLACSPSANNINSHHPSHRTALLQRQRTTADDLTVLFLATHSLEIRSSEVSVQQYRLAARCFFVVIIIITGSTCVECAPRATACDPTKWKPEVHASAASIRHDIRCFFPSPPTQRVPRQERCRPLAERGHNRRAARRVIDIIHHASTRRSLHCAAPNSVSPTGHPPRASTKEPSRELSPVSSPPAADPTPTSSPARRPCPCELDLRVKINLHCCLFPCTRLLDLLPSFADTRFYTYIPTAPTTPI